MTSQAGLSITPAWPGLWPGQRGAELPVTSCEVSGGVSGWMVGENTRCISRVRE